MGFAEELREGGSYQAAARWYRCAAEQGDVWGQAFLGHLYLEGKGVPVDDVQAYAWLNLAMAILKTGELPYLWARLSFETVQRYADLAARWFSEVAGRLSPAVLSEAQTLSRQYWRKYVEPSQGRRLKGGKRCVA